MPAVSRGRTERGTSAPTARRTRFPCFDGLRAIAAVLVLIGHVTFNARANRYGWLGPFVARTDIGVAFFFLISGFLLYRPFCQAGLTGEAGPRFGPYMRRRILRIIPAYWVALTFSLFLFRTQPHLGLKDAVIYYGFLQIYDKSHALGGMLQAWSLCTEMSFYLFLPVWAWLAQRASRRAATVAGRARVQLAGVAVLYGFSVAFRLLIMSGAFRSGFVLGPFVMTPGIAANWLPATLDYFALGMLLAVVSGWAALSKDVGRLAEALGATPWLWWTLAGAAFWVVSTQIGLPLDLRPYGEATILARQLLYGLVAFCLLMPAVFGEPNRGLIRRALQNRTVQWLGVISYGLYLWHLMWLHQFLTWTATREFQGRTLEMLVFVFVLTVASAALSWAIVERPALRHKDASWPLHRRRRRQVEPVVPAAAAVAGTP
jgi:peptidoglycan/LPS O-acetylase OafA/YrhL